MDAHGKRIYRTRRDPIIESYVLKADMAAQRAADLDPRTADAYMALGSLQILRMKFLSAGELFAKTLTLDEDNPDTLNLYGMMPSGRRWDCVPGCLY